MASASSGAMETTCVQGRYFRGQWNRVGDTQRPDGGRSQPLNGIAAEYAMRGGQMNSCTGLVYRSAAPQIEPPVLIMSSNMMRTLSSTGPPIMFF